MVINVSVIIPVYNAKNTISEAIDSILNQTYQKFEIVIIDDGSTDNTESILKKYMNKEEKIKVYTQVNQGVSKARNNGIKKATGKYKISVMTDKYLEVYQQVLAKGVE